MRSLLLASATVVALMATGPVHAGNYEAGNSAATNTSAGQQRDGRYGGFTPRGMTNAESRQSAMHGRTQAERDKGGLDVRQ